MNKISKIIFKIEKNYLIILVLSIFLIGLSLGSYTTYFLMSVNENQTLPGQIELEPLQKERVEAQVTIVAVDYKGKGLLSLADVEIIPGKGRVLFNANPFVEPDTQSSLEIAKRIAEQFTGKSLNKKDVIYSVEDIQAKLIGGPSAGAAFTVATIAAIQGKKVKQDVAITGTIELDSSIGQIGGIVEKLQAAAEQGKKVFLIPKGQKILTYYERQVEVEQRGFITIERTKIVPKQLDLSEFGKELGIEVKEVSNIQEVVQEMLE